MDKKRICVLSVQEPFVRGGAERMVSTLVQQLMQRGFAAELVQLPFHQYSLEGQVESAFSWRLLDLSESNSKKIDLVIATKFPSYLIEHKNKTLWLMHQHRVAYDLYGSKQYGGLKYHESGEKYRDIFRQADNQALPTFRRRYAISKNVANRLEKYNHLSAEPLYSPPPLAGRYRSAGYGGYILSAGRLDPIKRNELLIRALPFCAPDLRVKIAGEGRELRRLQRLAVVCGVADRVDFLGYVPDEDLLELYANAFAVFFAPIDEDYGYITLESFLSKRPVITCADSGGVLEFVKDGETGFACGAGPEPIAQAINRLYQNKPLCRELGENGYSLVKDLSWDRVVECLTQTL